MAATGETDVLLSPDGVLHYLHGPTAKSDFLKRYRNKKVTAHNLKVLVGTSETSNLKEGHDKSHMGGWVRYDQIVWLRSSNGTLVYYFGDPFDAAPFLCQVRSWDGPLAKEMDAFDAARLAKLVRGKLRSHGKSTLVAKLKLPDHTTVSWEVVAAPDDAEDLILSGAIWPVKQLGVGDRFARPAAAALAVQLAEHAAVTQGAVAAIVGAAGAAQQALHSLAVASQVGPYVNCHFLKPSQGMCTHMLALTVRDIHGRIAETGLWRCFSLGSVLFF